MARMPAWKSREQVKKLGMSVLRSIYATPKTLLEMLIECGQFIDTARQDQGYSKLDVLESMENRISLLVGKLVAQPTCAAFTIYPATDSTAEAGEDEAGSMGGTVSTTG